MQIFTFFNLRGGKRFGGKFTSVMIFFSVVLLAWAILPPAAANAEEGLRYSCSAQVYEAFEMERLEAFTAETGIAVDLHIGASYSSILRLMNDMSDIASSSERLYRRHRDKGYIETVFCRDPLAVIANSQCPVADLSLAQLQDIFSGELDNWKTLGGPDRPILVVVPSEETAAYRNFDRLVMKRLEINHDCMTYKSTTVIDIVQHHPWAISFISRGAATNYTAVKTLSIDGLHPKAPGYPYSQVFSFVTKGVPTGQTKEFIDFALSAKGQAIMRDNGMVPIK